MIRTNTYFLSFFPSCYFYLLRYYFYLVVYLYDNEKILCAPRKFVNLILKTFPLEVVYMTIGNPAFCLALYFAGVHFRGQLQHVGDVNE